MSLRVMSPAMLNAWSQTLVRAMSTQGGSKNIGFVGLGNMGANMASNLIKAGHKLHVYDISKPACDGLAAKGATVYSKTSELAKNSDFVITMLPNNAIVEASYEEMSADGVNKDTIFIDSSTISPELVKSLQKKISGKGARFIDAPVSGGVPGAEQATLTFMVGGTEAEYNAVKAVLECMGKRITHCGVYGMGQAAKLCNNMMLAISMIGVSEAMNLAVRQGLDANVFAEIINSSTGRCWASEIYNPVPGVCPTAPANRDYAGGFSTALITKDLGLASGVASTSNSPIPLGSLAHKVYQSLCEKGLGNKDFSVVYDLMKKEKFSV
ncbi:probable 3-hydroxyisobutyrate dehydrogenase, mitochondrial [Drosophila eugracilis]|uniref:probable 3-hydroxyisobutyrate dehydrogenase, mitochondrial n=1 Tax=Drosophila eugracilis TaxID=29029 RepID=UPI0007E6780C|nr:probable 3-hydroxyisobutyrate dehydrogenase, mitochondrial [Drosophila eugracilis]